ncbi:DUF1631 family protein [Undibacterium sp. SXout7W]|uniref:DUF1631 family protein n=1 Tax=Undibacterium sp. SXout7W TaxID=3413049 RepID=UPI003BF195D0
MVPNDVLSNARAEFTHAFQNAIQDLVPAAIEALFVKAEAATSHEQKLIFHARALIQDKREQLMQQLMLNMAQLLDRSLETAYSNFRPSSVLNQDVESLALLDPSVFENSLRFNEITQHFRDKAEQQLRELNIRIAVLFEKEDMCERENPFRPYLLTRCISQAIEALGLLPELNTILILQLGECLQHSVADMYRATNVCLENLGVSANLTLKITKAPNTLNKLKPSAPGVSPAGATFSEMPVSAGAAPGSGPHPAVEQIPPAIQHPQGWIEQLFHAARRKSAAPSPSAISTSSVATASFGSPVVANGSDTSWLAGSMAIGGLLRKVFGTSAPGSAALTGAATSENTALPLGEVETNSGRVTSTEMDISSLAALRLPHSAGISAEPGSASEPKVFPAIEIRLIKVIGRMHRQMTPEAAAMVNENGDIRNLLREHRDALHSLAQTGDEKMTVDIVAMLFEFILRDALLSLNTRIQIGRLQFLMLQQALLEPAFLTETHHAARLLLNRLATVAFAVSKVEPGVSLFDDELARLVKTLLRYDCEVPDLFPKVQERFDTVVGRLLRHCDVNVKLAVKAVSEAETLRVRFVQTHQQLSHALSRLHVDPYFRHFLLYDWSSAIVRAERMDPRWARRYRLLVPDIFWSLSPKVSVEDRNQLSAMIPVMLNNLHQGLEMLAWDKTEQQMLLNWLADAHAEALRPGHAVQEPTSLFDMHDHFGQFTDQPDSLDVEDESEEIPESVPDFLPAVIRDSRLAITFLHRPAHHDDSATSTYVRQNHLQPVIPTVFQIGTALEVQVQGSLQPACIMWVNQDMSNLILRFQENTSVVLMSCIELQHMLQSEQARFPETEPLFERAIRSLLVSADAIDHDDMTAQH